MPNGIAKDEDGLAFPQLKEAMQGEKGDEVIGRWKSAYLCCQGEG